MALPRPPKPKRAPKPPPEARARREKQAPGPPRPKKEKGPRKETRPKTPRPARVAPAMRRFGAWLLPVYTRRVSRPKAVLILVLNVAPLPGLGTAIYGHWERGLMQLLLTFVFLIGWVWSVFDGFRILSASLRPPVHLRKRSAPKHG